MTDLIEETTPSDRSQGKRERLVASASRLLYEQGVERTSLADIAGAAGVPLGNVYYYFKTKDELVAAVIEAHAQSIEATLALVDRKYRTPPGRLKGFLDSLAGYQEEISQHGCPYGTLVAEIDKRRGEADPTAARLMQLRVDWAQRQFEDMGRRDADDLAVEFIARYQGATILAAAFGAPELMNRQVRGIQSWVDSIARRGKAPRVGGRDRDSV